MRLILLLLALLVAGGCDRQKPEVQQGEAAGAGPVQGIDRSKKGRSAPETQFKDPDGNMVGFADFEGKALLVNLWATWCAPCVEELPTLDSLAERQGRAMAVIAISQDMAPQGSVRAFLDKLGVESLEPYQDDKMALSGVLGVEVLPTTILFDANGRELWRYVGDLDWTGAEAARLLAEAGAATLPIAASREEAR